MAVLFCAEAKLGTRAALKDMQIWCCAVILSAGETGVEESYPLIYQHGWERALCRDDTPKIFEIYKRIFKIYNTISCLDMIKYK